MALNGNTRYVSDNDHERVVRFDLPSGKPTGYWQTESKAAGIALDSSGAVYVVDVTGTLTKYSPRA